MGKTCKLKDVSFQCMTKFTTNKKIKKKIKKKTLIFVLLKPKLGANIPLPKSYFFENINTANKILTRFINKKETKTYQE